MATDYKEKFWEVIAKILEQESPSEENLKNLNWLYRQEEIIKIAIEADRERLMSYFGDKLKNISKNIAAQNPEASRELKRIAFQIELLK
jgi:hypothetical protein